MGFWSVARLCSARGCPQQAMGRVVVEWRSSLLLPSSYCFCAQHKDAVLAAVRAPLGTVVHEPVARQAQAAEVCARAISGEQQEQA